jgi:hypothetical protein
MHALVPSGAARGAAGTRHDVRTRMKRQRKNPPRDPDHFGARRGS